MNYANTLYQPPEPFFQDKQWAHITDWRSELTPYYEQAQKMLGVVRNPHMTPADEIMKSVADDMGVGDTFIQTPVGVYFGEPGKKAKDPYFGGVGPERTGCIECGECMTGCRHGAKNTLLKNYLGLAETAGAEIIPMTTVSGLREARDGSWDVFTERTGAFGRKNRRTYTAANVILAAGTWGTQHLLFDMKDTGALPKLSDKLGELTRTNSESIVGAGKYKVDPALDLTRGVAITSSFHPSSDTHIEPVRYGKGSNAMGLLQTLMTDGGGNTPRWIKFLGVVAKNPYQMLRMLTVKDWSERTIIALVMQNLDNSITTYTKKGLFGRRKVTSKQGHGQPNPTWIPEGNEATRRVAEKIDGVAGGTWGEIFNVPLTAHFLGGCAIASDSDHGVIDPYPPRVRLPDAQRRRRRSGLGQPRRESVADHCRSGRALGLAVAEQGGDRPASRPGQRLRAFGSDCTQVACGAGVGSGRAGPADREDHRRQDSYRCSGGAGSRIVRRERRWGVSSRIRRHAPSLFQSVSLLATRTECRGRGCPSRLRARRPYRRGRSGSAARMRRPCSPKRPRIRR